VLPQVELLITRGRAQNRQRPVRGTAFLIGSAADSDLVLGDPSFDELHSYVFVRPEGVTVRHLGTGPELSVAGQPVLVAPLTNDDRLGLGPFEFQVRIAPAPGASSHRQTTRQAVSNDVALERLLYDVEHAACRLGLYDDEGPRAATLQPDETSDPPSQSSVRLRRAGL